MACLRRLSATLLAWNTKRTTYFLSGSSVNITTNVPETDVEQKHEAVNTAILAGIATAPQPEGNEPHFSLQHYGSIKVKVYASKNSPELKSILRKVEDGMNIAVEGQMAQRRNVRKIGEDYRMVDETFINAEKIEILENHKDVERKYDERYKRIYTHDKRA